MTQARSFPIARIAVAVAAVTVVGVVVFRVALSSTAVDVVVAVEGIIAQEVKGPGSVSSRTEVNVSSRITGVVDTVLVQEGDKVTEGQLLASLDQRDLAAKAAAARSGGGAARQGIVVAEAALEKARADLALARANHQRDEQVFNAGHLSQSAFDAATAALRVTESAEKNAAANVAARQEDAKRASDETRYADTIQSHAQIVSPIAGLVTKRQVEVGTTVAPGNTLFRIVDDQTVCVATRVDVSQMGKIEVGQRARIRLASGDEATGTVARVSHEADPVTRDQEVRVKFDTPPAHLTLKEEAEVVVGVGEARGLVVPGSVLLPREGKDGVVVVRDGRAVYVPVQVGAVGQGKVQILGGLNVGDIVIAHPTMVKANQRVHAATPGKG
jgi:HlyD family secretion protein